MIDNYSHVDSTIYVLENIPGPKEESWEYTEIISKYNSQLSNSCLCATNCTSPQCSCLNSSTCVTEDNNGKYSRPLFECNTLCTCTSSCPNRVVQKGPINGLSIQKCTDAPKGYGLFAQYTIPKNTFICEYAGEVITINQALNRQHFNTINDKMNYIFCLNEHSSGNVTRTIVDPSDLGNIGRYINHSCEPNSVIVPVRVDSAIPKLAIFSQQDILPGSEITFQYGASSNPSSSDKLCFCKSAKCTGYLPIDVY